jgi:hypothetical protein
MKEKFKKSLKLEKRTIRKLNVRSGLRGGKGLGSPPTDDCTVYCDTPPIKPGETNNFKCL